MTAAAYQSRIKGLLFRLSPGVRVQARPHTDAWMSGDRYGAVAKVGRKWLHVRMDSGRVRKFLIEGDDGFSAHVPGIQLVFDPPPREMRKFGRGIS